MTPLEIQPFDGAGAEVFGADLSTISVGDWNQLEAAFASFGLLVFRDQVLSLAELQDFGRRWGTIGAVSEFAGRNSWRADGSHLERPPHATLLTPVGRPADNTTSRFCSVTAAFAALSTTSQRELEGLTAHHTDGGTSSAHHPLVIVNDLSSRKTLYVNPMFTASIDDMDDLNGLALLNQLGEHCQRDEFCAEVTWEPGTVVLVDNRSTWQLDRTDLTPAGFRLYQLRVEGDALVPAARTESTEPSLVQRAGATLAGGVITAAMTGIAEVIEPEKARADIEIVSEAPEQEPLTPLDFGNLPPLD